MLTKAQRLDIIEDSLRRYRETNAIQYLDNIETQIFLIRYYAVTLTV